MSGITLQEVGGDLVINVPDAQTSIGRGSFLQVSDKRVSRSHAVLEVVERKLYITPTHTNPCFLRPQDKDQRVLPKDVQQILNHGDSFGLLPDQLFYKVMYPQVNGKDKSAEDEKGEPVKDGEVEKDEEAINDSGDGDKVAKASDDVKDVPKMEEAGDSGNEGKEEKENKEISPSTPKKEEKQEGEESEEEENEAAKKEDSKASPAEDGETAMPLNKKRPLPNWMVKAAGESPKKPNASPKKPVSKAVDKRESGTKLTKDAAADEDEISEENEVVEPRKAKGGKTDKDSDEEEDFEADMSDDDYVPEEAATGRGRARRKRSESNSDEDFSEDDDDYSPKRKKSKSPKKPVRGKGKRGAKGKKTPSRAVRKTPQRSRRAKKSDDDDDDDDVPLPRGHNLDDDDDDDSPSKSRPQRAARAKRGSYVDDPMIEEALEDFASDGDDNINEDKDSDFEVDGAEDSGSDWEKRKGGSHKASKGGKAKGPPRGPTKKGKKKTPRRRSKTYSDDDDDVMEDDEPYKPRPSKRRGGAVVKESDESDDDKKKKRRRERCQYGHKCYRKNAVHFRTFCHPGDSSYDEEDGEGNASRDGKKEKESRSSPEKPSRPQRSTAGTRLVTHGSVADDDLPDTYDYNDSFIDDGTQPTDDSGDSDYNAEDDVKGPARDAKKLLKNKKMAKPGETPEETECE